MNAPVGPTPPRITIPIERAIDSWSSSAEGGSGGAGARPTRGDAGSASARSAGPPTTIKPEFEGGRQAADAGAGRQLEGCRQRGLAHPRPARAPRASAAGSRCRRRWALRPQARPDSPSAAPELGVGHGLWLGLAGFGRPCSVAPPSALIALSACSRLPRVREQRRWPRRGVGRGRRRSPPPPPTYKANDVDGRRAPRRAAAARHEVPHERRQGGDARRRARQQRSADHPDVQLLRLSDAVQPAAQRAVRRAAAARGDHRSGAAAARPRQAVPASSRSISSRPSRSDEAREDEAALHRSRRPRRADGWTFLLASAHRPAMRRPDPAASPTRSASTSEIHPKDMRGVRATPRR